MGFTYSTDQQAVIDARNQNILVSAAAGSGKTSVLTQRIVGLVSDPVHPVDIDRVLVVTYTNAAAKEMKDRIGARLNDLLAENPSNEHLQKQATLIHSAQISTIHSFCLYLLKNHFHRINLDPSYRVASEGEITLLKEDVLNDVIKRAYKSMDEDFYHVVDCYSKKDKDDSLKESIKKLHGYACSYPWPLDWLNKRRMDYDFKDSEALEESKLIKDIKEEILRQIDASLVYVEKALKLSLTPQGPYTYEETLSKDKDLLESLKSTVSQKKFGELKEIFDSVSFDRMKNANKDADPFIKEAASNNRKTAKKLFDDIKEDYFSFDIDTIFSDLKATNRVVNKLIDLVCDYYDALEKEKRSRGIIDFSDMEHLAVTILIESYNPDDGSYVITDVAKNYRDYFEEVMVDEYQDANLVQELIIQSVSRETEESRNNRFMVGDIKQSIYRFRLARPDIFGGKLDSYKQDEKSKDRLITLKENYRSRDSVINSVNAVFEASMKKEIGGVGYDADARLYKGGHFSPDNATHTTEVMLVPGEETSDAARKAEAKAIALRILDIVDNFEVYDGKADSLRKAKFSDIALLFRSPTKWNDYIKDAFEEYNIPFHSEGVGNFYDTTEIRDVLSFLSVLNNPLDNIAMYASLTSPFGKMTDEEIAYIKANNQGFRYLYDALKESVKEKENEKISAFLERINRYRRYSQILPISELIERLFNETGYENIVAAMPNGSQRLANVKMLLIKATEYAKTSFYGLFHFLRYVELLKKTDVDEGEALQLDEGADVVKVMSIHKSKGLEFPVCFIGGMDEKFNEQDLRAQFVMDVDEGIGASFLDPEDRIKRSTIKKDYIISKLKRENIGEEIRVLYVGMTRAKEKLIMVGCVKDVDNWFETGSVGEYSSYLSIISEGVLGSLNKYFVRYDPDFSKAEEKLIKKEADLSILKAEFLDETKGTDENLLKNLRERFSFKYPYEALSRLYTKTTVSKLKAEPEMPEDNESKQEFVLEEEEYVPIFAGGKEDVKGTARGTAYHKLLKLLDFSKFSDGPMSKEEIREELLKQFKSLNERNKMPKEETDLVFMGKIVSFFESNLAKEMIKASKEEKLFREQPFVIGVDASMIDETFPKGETILVQGVIDAYYILGDNLVILDYKTDKVDSKEELIVRYKKQLEYYAKALEQITGLKASRLYIYSFGLSEAFMIN